MGKIMAVPRGDNFERKVLKREVLWIYRPNYVSPGGLSEELSLLISCRPEVKYFDAHFMNTSDKI